LPVDLLDRGVSVTVPSDPDHGDRGRPVRRAVAVSVLVVFVVSAITMTALDRGADGGLIEGLFVLAGFGAFAGLGALLIDRGVGGLLGPLFAASGVLTVVFGVAEVVAIRAIVAGDLGVVPRLLLWPTGWYWYAVLAVLFVYVPTLFPDGRLPSPRWRWVAVPVTVSLVAACVIASTTATFELRAAPGLVVANPLGLPGVPFAEDNPWFQRLFVVYVGIAMGVASVVVRFRRSGGAERAQMKWFLFAVALVPLAPLSEAVPGRVGDAVGAVVFVLALLGLPISIGIAILRYRLFEIDRLISRTIGYAIVIGSLVVLYAGAVLVLGRLVDPLTGGSDLAVAASTLAVAAAFRPLRNRVQSQVDRRFNRSRYDAAASTEALAGRLRDEVDLHTLAHDLTQVVDRTLQPVVVGLWLRADEVADAQPEASLAASSSHASGSSANGSTSR
jgi:hypothetical protein